MTRNTKQLKSKHNVYSSPSGKVSLTSMFLVRLRPLGDFFISRLSFKGVEIGHK